MVQDLYRTDQVAWWAQKQRIARAMTDEGLCFSRDDCLACVKAGVEPEKYTDEASVYVAEGLRRLKAHAKTFQRNLRVTCPRAV